MNSRCNTISLKKEFSLLKKKYKHLDQQLIQDIIDDAFLLARKNPSYKNNRWILFSVKWDLMDLDKSYARKNGTWKKPKPPEVEVTVQPKDPVIDPLSTGLGEYSMSDCSEMAERRVVLDQIMDIIPEKDKSLLIKFLLDRPMTRSEQKQLERLTGYLRAELGEDP